MVWLRLWEYQKFLFWSEKNPSVFSTEIFPVRTNTEVCWATYILTEYWLGPDRESVFLPYWLFFSSSVLTFSYAYPLEGCGGSSLSREICFLPSHLLHLSRGTLRRSHAGPVTLGLHHCLLPIRHVGNTWPKRRPGGPLVRCPKYLNWLLLLWSSTLCALLKRLNSLFYPHWRGQRPLEENTFRPLLPHICDAFFPIANARHLTRCSDSSHFCKTPLFLLNLRFSYWKTSPHLGIDIHLSVMAQYLEHSPPSWWYKPPLQSDNFEALLQTSTWHVEACQLGWFCLRLRGYQKILFEVRKSLQCFLHWYFL